MYQSLLGTQTEPYLICKHVVLILSGIGSKNVDKSCMYILPSYIQRLCLHLNLPVRRATTVRVSYTCYPPHPHCRISLKTNGLRVFICQTLILIRLPTIRALLFSLTDSNMIHCLRVVSTETFETAIKQWISAKSCTYPKF